MIWEVRQGDALEVMRTLLDGSVSTIVTSPPYFSLRSYLPSDHPDKDKEMGSEQGPGAFLDALLDVLDESYRVLAPWGSMFVNIGDTYAGSGGAGGDYEPGSLRASQRKFEGSGIKSRRYRAQKLGPFDGALEKSLSMIPQALGFALVYGRNPFNGRECNQWRVRNWNVWVKRNPAVGQIIDKWRPASEPVIFAVKERQQFFDLQAIRRVPKSDPRLNGGVVRSGLARGHERADSLETRPEWRPDRVANAGGAPPLDWWDVTPVQLPEAHFAAFPPKLIEDPIKATCPVRVCRECGKPSERIVETTNAVGRAMGRASWRDDPDTASRMHTGAITETASQAAPRAAETRTIGWTDCGHDAYEPGLVLDPFCGSGTTGIVARRLGRRFLGIELSEEYVEMSRRRIARALLPEPKRSKPQDLGPQGSLL